MASKFVSYPLCCFNCKSKNKPESEEPCNDCLSEPVNEDSQRAIHYEPVRKEKVNNEHWVVEDISNGTNGRYTV